jgi:hypothetical protein
MVIPVLHPPLLLIILFLIGFLDQVLFCSAGENEPLIPVHA